MINRAKMPAGPNNRAIRIAQFQINRSIPSCQTASYMLKLTDKGVSVHKVNLILGPLSTEFFAITEYVNIVSELGPLTNYSRLISRSGTNF